MTIFMAGVVTDSVVDGPGLRTAYFCQGCPHHCPGCHNPETWPFDGGTPMEMEALYRVARADPLCRGVTFSGGEPFCQAEGFAELAALLRGDGIEIASYTGYTFEHLRDHGTDAQRRLLSLLDVLVDGPFLLAERSLELPFRGSRNQRILDVPRSLAAGRPVPAPARWQGIYP